MNRIDDGQTPAIFEFQEVPPSQAVQEAVTKAIANVGANISPLPWKDRLAFFGKAIRDAVRNLKLGYDSSWSSTLYNFHVGAGFRALPSLGPHPIPLPAPNLSKNFIGLVGGLRDSWRRMLHRPNLFK